MHGPIFSTITLFTELVVSMAVYYTIYRGYRSHKFPTKLALAALTYETIFNITYMFSRVPSHAKVANRTPLFLTLLAVTHGVLSLIMFVALVVFFFFAWKTYGKERNFFLEHKKLTFAFLFFWTFSIASGVVFYFLEYGA